jgi:hypothetical protein
MSNRGETWRKFVQTFFLAEQPNGYFVLNDIFRFLKEESVEGDDADESIEPEAEPRPVSPRHLRPSLPLPLLPLRPPFPPPLKRLPQLIFPNPLPNLLLRHQILSPLR